jgi:hypothetical protein
MVIYSPPPIKMGGRAPVMKTPRSLSEKRAPGTNESLCSRLCGLAQTSEEAVDAFEKRGGVLIEFA